MKQLILDTRHIIPTGDKQRPVVVRPTLAGRLLNSAFAAVLAIVAVTRWCDNSLSHNFHYYMTLGILVLGVAYLVHNAVCGEHPENILDTDEYVNRQQYALYIWKMRLQNGCLSLLYICFCLCDAITLLGYTGLVFLALFFLVKWYFYQQIKQAAHLTSDLQLAPRVEVTLGVTPLARKLEAASLASMALAIGVALWVGGPVEPHGRAPRHHVDLERLPGVLRGGRHLLAAQDDAPAHQRGRPGGGRRGDARPLDGAARGAMPQHLVHRGTRRSLPSHLTVHRCDARKTDYPPPPQTFAGEGDSLSCGGLPLCAWPSQAPIPCCGGRGTAGAGAQNSSGDADGRQH